MEKMILDASKHAKAEHKRYFLLLMHEVFACLSDFYLFFLSMMSRIEIVPVPCLLSILFDSSIHILIINTLNIWYCRMPRFIIFYGAL